LIPITVKKVDGTSFRQGFVRTDEMNWREKSRLQGIFRMR